MVCEGQRGSVQTIAFALRAFQHNATSERSEQGAFRSGPVKSNVLFDSFAMPAADAFARTLGPPTPPPAPSNGAGASRGAPNPRACPGEGRLVVNRATRVCIGESLCNRLPYIDFVGEIVPAGISGKLLDEPEGVGADVGGLTHARNIERTHGASKRADPAFKVPNAHATSCPSFAPQGTAAQKRRPQATV